MKMKNQIKYSFKTLESNYRDIKFDPDIWEAIKKDINFQLETFHEGITDGYQHTWVLHTKYYIRTYTQHYIGVIIITQYDCNKVF